jgi:hypothetical protein
MVQADLFFSALLFLLILVALLETHASNRGRGGRRGTRPAR